jgi:crotonobetainyl-CoA:carnitine CoA-transferase CaiB-like acyl-CoA transferase
VLRIDPPDWDEPGVVPLVMWGKRTARVDARSVAGAERLAALLAEADVLVHGYRPGALEHLGLGPEQREALRPGLVDVAVCAYGWTGPWSGRRGFDSLVQFSAGIAHTGMRAAGADRPVSLPVQALDYATGYLAGAAALAGLTGRLRDGLGSRWRLSLARTAVELERAATLPDAPAGTSGRVADEVRRTLVGTPIGGIALAAPPFEVDGVVLDPGALGAPLGRDAPRWG